MMKIRLNRATYWALLAFVALIYIALSLTSNHPGGVQEGFIVFICGPRLQDIGKSGWLALWLIGIEFAGLGIGAALSTLNSFVICADVAQLIMAGLMIWLGCIPGDEGANRFGDAPPPGIIGLFKKKS